MKILTTINGQSIIQMDTTERKLFELFQLTQKIDTTPEVKQIHLPELSQGDPRWRAHPLGQKTGHKLTIGSWGCLLTVYTAIAQFWGINEGRNPAEENDYYAKRGGFNSQYIASMAMAQVYPQVKSNGYMKASSKMHDKAKKYLMRGVPVPARVDWKPATKKEEQHWIALVGWDADKQDYLMLDPWIGRVAYVAEHYAIDGSDILECLFYELEA